MSLHIRVAEAMDPDEFLRKYHPLPALLNLLGNTQTKATEVLKFVSHMHNLSFHFAWVCWYYLKKRQYVSSCPD